MSWSEPCWRTREELFLVLQEYRQWKEQGLSDAYFSRQLKKRFPDSYAPRGMNRGFQRAKPVAPAQKQKQPDSMSKWFGNK